MPRYQPTAADAAMTIDAHKDWVVHSCFSSDGQQIISASRDKKARVWDSPSGQRLVSLSGIYRMTSCAAGFEKDSFVTTSLDGCVRLWAQRKKNWKKRATLRGHTDVALSCDHSSVDSRVASGSNDRSLRVWDTNAGSSIFALQGHRGPVMRVRYSSDGGMMASGSGDRTVKIWDARGGSSAKIAKFCGHLDAVTSVAFSSDGWFLASCGTDKRVNVWELRTRQLLFRICDSHPFTVNDVAFSREGGPSKFLATASDDATIKIWSSENGSPVLHLSGHRAAVTGLDWSPVDACCLLSSSKDKTIKTWNIQAP